VVYVDSTIALPLLTHYTLARGRRRQPRRLYDRLPELLAMLEAAFAEKRDERLGEGTFSLEDISR
jgi:hypothetical protein